MLMKCVQVSAGLCLQKYVILHVGNILLCCCRSGGQWTDLSVSVEIHPSAGFQDIKWISILDSSFV